MSDRVPTGEWLRGVLETCVLQTMTDRPTYGYAIITALAAAGLGEIKGGTLYPLLARLEKKGLVSVEWRAGDGGPGRKYFALTAAGREELKAAREQWGVFVTTVSTHLAVDVDREATQEVPR
ncbi:PadR family transcriptional regulator [Kocuria soli]|uniref:PadR family transcriptional regulator n=1 Tax=Kocuria soli TaxID=2485125 RepID=A0A3N3ZPG1_9MICC|nr:PadR family transcriptional regulator [Kocuria soli]ROZ62866.1 PadR family transcriptional regulator [Kocuria soli]